MRAPHCTPTLTLHFSNTPRLPPLSPVEWRLHFLGRPGLQSPTPSERQTPKPEVRIQLPRKPLGGLLPWRALPQAAARSASAGPSLRSSPSGCFSGPQSPLPAHSSAESVSSLVNGLLHPAHREASELEHLAGEGACNFCGTIQFRKTNCESITLICRDVFYGFSSLSRPSVATNSQIKKLALCAAPRRSVRASA